MTLLGKKTVKYIPMHICLCAETNWGENINTEIHRLQKENLKIRLETKKEKESIREFYETIAFGRSRSGIMVREAMGSSSAAGTMMQELKSLFDVNQDSNYLWTLPCITFAIHFLCKSNLLLRWSVSSSSMACAFIPGSTAHSSLSHCMWSQHVGMIIHICFTQLCWHHYSYQLLHVVYGGENRGHSEGKKEEEDVLHKVTQLNRFVTKSLLSLQCCLCTTDIIIKRTMSETLIAMEQCSCIDISYLKWHYQCYFNMSTAILKWFDNTV